MKDFPVVSSISTETDCHRRWRSAYQWWFLGERQFIFSNWYNFLTCEAEYVQGLLLTSGFCCWQGDWERSRAFLAEMRLRCSGVQTNPFALWQTRIAEAPASRSLWAKLSPLSRAIQVHRFRLVAYSVQRLPCSIEKVSSPWVRYSWSCLSAVE